MKFEFPHRAVFAFLEENGEYGGIMVTQYDGDPELKEQLELGEYRDLISQRLDIEGYEDTFDFLRRCSVNGQHEVPKSGIWIWEGIIRATCSEASDLSELNTEDFHYETTKWRKPSDHEMYMIVDGKNPFMEEEPPAEKSEDEMTLDDIQRAHSPKFKW